MARIRTIKPGLWSDDLVADLSRDARLLFIGLISLADDEGRFVASAATLAGHIYPHDELPPTTIRRWLREIETKDREHAERTGKGLSVVLYQVGRAQYGWLPKYRRHQRISHPQPSALPPPPGEETLL